MLMNLLGTITGLNSLILAVGLNYNMSLKSTELIPHFDKLIEEHIKCNLDSFNQFTVYNVYFYKLDKGSIIDIGAPNTIFTENANKVLYFYEYKGVLFNLIAIGLDNKAFMDRFFQIEKEDPEILRRIIQPYQYGYNPIWLEIKVYDEVLRSSIVRTCKPNER